MAKRYKKKITSTLAQRRARITAMLKKTKDHEFLQEIEDLVANGKKWTEEEKLDRNFGIPKKTIPFKNTGFNRGENMMFFLNDIWPE